MRRRLRIVEIPHLFQLPLIASEADRLRYRQSLGIAPGAFLLGTFGYLRESKRLIPALQAFAEIHRELPETAMLVAGSFVSRDLARAATPLLDAPSVVRLPHLSESDFWLAAASVDACTSPEIPARAAGETSGIAIRLMGLGKPVIVTDSPECARYPEDACVRIPPGAAEGDSLRHYMVLLASRPRGGQINRRERGGAHASAAPARWCWPAVLAGARRMRRQIKTAARLTQVLPREAGGGCRGKIERRVYWSTGRVRSGAVRRASRDPS